MKTKKEMERSAMKELEHAFGIMLGEEGHCSSKVDSRSGAQKISWFYGATGNYPEPAESSSHP
jgi:hypothetical protein